MRKASKSPHTTGCNGDSGSGVSGSTSLWSAPAAANGAHHAGAAAAAPAPAEARPGVNLERRGSKLLRRPTVFPKSFQDSLFGDNRQNEQKASTNFAAGHLRAKDIVHINTHAWRMKLMQRLLYGPPSQVLSFALLVYVLISMFFALIFFAFGKGCFRLEDENEFGYASCLWISIHVFSTIGFGNIAPKQTCVGAQIALLVEFFVSLLIVSAIGGYVVKMFLTPLSSIRFSTVVLLNNGRRRIAMDDEEVARNKHAQQYRFLTFRMVRLGNAQLRDIHIHVQAQWWHAKDSAFSDRDSHKGRVGTLSLEHEHFTTLEQLQVWHKLDENSPLWGIESHLETYLDGIEVTVSAFDMASLQPVKMFTRYQKQDLVVNAVFVNTLSSANNLKEPDQLLADHSKLDMYEDEEPQEDGQRRVKKKRNSSQSAPSSLSSACLTSFEKAANAAAAMVSNGVREPGRESFRDDSKKSTDSGSSGKGRDSYRDNSGKGRDSYRDNSGKGRDSYRDGSRDKGRRSRSTRRRLSGSQSALSSSIAPSSPMSPQCPYSGGEVPRSPQALAEDAALPPNHCDRANPHLGEPLQV